MPLYPWPASGITEADMRLLFHAREQSPSRVPINALIAEAIRKTFAPTTKRDEAPPQPDQAEARQA